MDETAGEEDQRAEVGPESAGAQEAEAEVYDTVRRRLAASDSRAVKNWEQYSKRFQDQLAGIEKRLEHARSVFVRSAEVFRKKLTAGPLAQEEFRARMVMLEMEYSSRVRLAEEGFSLLKRGFDEHASRERAWLQGVLDEVGQTVRTRIHSSRSQVAEALFNRERKLDEARERLSRLEHELETERSRVREREAQLQQVENAGAQREEARGEAGRLKLELEEERRKTARLETELKQDRRELERIRQESDRVRRDLEAERSLRLSLERERAQAEESKPAEDPILTRETDRGFAAARAELASLRRELEAERSLRAGLELQRSQVVELKPAEAPAQSEAKERELAAAQAELEKTRSELDAVRRELESERGRQAAPTAQVLELTLSEAPAQGAAVLLSPSAGGLEGGPSATTPAQEAELAAARSELEKARAELASLRESLELERTLRMGLELERSKVVELKPVEAPAESEAKERELAAAQAELASLRESLELERTLRMGLELERSKVVELKPAESPAQSGEKERELSSARAELDALRQDLEAERSMRVGLERERGKGGGGNPAELEKARADLAEMEAQQESLMHEYRKKFAEAKELRVQLGEAQAQREETQAKLQMLKKKLETSFDKTMPGMRLDLGSEGKQGGGESASDLALKRLSEENIRLKAEVKAAWQAAPAAGASAGDAKLRQELLAVKSERDLAKAALQEAARAAQEKDALDKERTQPLAGGARSEGQLEESSKRWLAEKGELEEKLEAAARELGALRAGREESEKTWEATLARQDAMRMQEIFALRAHISQLESRGGKS